MRYILYQLLWTGILIFAACRNDQPKQRDHHIIQTKPEPHQQFVGGETCIECHDSVYRAYMGSDHDWAMKPPNDSTVLGDFNQAVFEHHGIRSEFIKKEDQYYVYTEGKDGVMDTFRVRYTFGYNPLQQYLIDFGKGKLQTLPLCWDSRPAAEGGQRWFHIYDQERILPDDYLYWTQPLQNWNYMCADCHSTHLVKNYDLSSDSYQTSWSDINVSCEACHGPGKKHTEWAVSYEEGHEIPAKNYGLLTELKQTKDQWEFIENYSTAIKTGSNNNEQLIETCAHCHSRRFPYADGFDATQKLIETHIPSLITGDLYFDDGQIKDEVYVYGSFLQSKMYHFGVNCIDCHDPHSSRVYSRENDLCAKCHRPEVYDTDSHHHHAAYETGHTCVDCHMPERTYMVVDPRRDHSFKIPRPDLSEKTGSPNSCNACHTDQSIRWAIAAMDDWYGMEYKNETNYAEVLHAHRDVNYPALLELKHLISDDFYPDIVRATAIEEWRKYILPEVPAFLKDLLKHSNPLIRLSALNALSSYPMKQKRSFLLLMVDDEVAWVAMQAALKLMNEQGLTEPEQLKVRNGVAAYLKSQLIHADNPAACLNIGNVYIQQGKLTEARHYYNLARKKEPAFVAAMVNLADLSRMEKNEDSVRYWIQAALKIEPENSSVLYAFAMHQIRLGEYAAAEKTLAAAMKQPDAGATTLQAYVLALRNNGKSKEAWAELFAFEKRYPGWPELMILGYQLAEQDQDIPLKTEYLNKLNEWELKYRELTGS